VHPLRARVKVHLRQLTFLFNFVAVEGILYIVLYIEYTDD